jgi:Flp pilus assembly pilin Flp
VKGAVGFAMPLIMISGLSLLHGPAPGDRRDHSARAFSNFLQAIRFGLAEMKATMVEYWRYILIVCVAIVIVAQFVTSLPTQTFYLILGIPVVVLSVIQLAGVRFRIPRRRRSWRSGSWA